jgi:hypothetical protein
MQTAPVIYARVREKSDGHRNTALFSSQSHSVSLACIALYDIHSHGTACRNECVPVDFAVVTYALHHLDLLTHSAKSTNF